MKIAEIGPNKMCIKETKEKRFYKVQAARNVKAPEKGFHKCKLCAMLKMQEQKIA